MSSVHEALYMTVFHVMEKNYVFFNVIPLKPALHTHDRDKKCLSTIKGKFHSNGATLWADYANFPSHNLLLSMCVFFTVVKAYTRPFFTTRKTTM